MEIASRIDDFIQTIEEDIKYKGRILKHHLQAIENDFA